ncbi:MAG: hypothetical protein LUG64_01475 [Clostridiales bacterium]|nr:hypothetical protein [Clostridiales bacterium]
MADESNTQTQTTQNPSDGAQNGQSAAANTGEGKDYTALFEKLDAILDKRSGGIAKSALKDNGIDDGEAAEIVAAYRQQKAGQAKQQSDALANLQRENQQLKDQMLRSQLEAEAMSQAATLNVAPETAPYLLRLADLSGAVDDKGAIDKEAVTAALNQVLENIPALKRQTTQSKGFVPIGGDGTDQQSAQAEDRMRAWFGLGPKSKT